MNSLRLGPLLRHVDDTSATIWVETERPGLVTVLGAETSTFTVKDHHYALVIVEGLTPGSVIEYQVEVDGVTVWPDADSKLPPSVIRPTPIDGEVTILAGSCRAAAPHEEPYTLELTLDHEGRGIDTLWAHAQRMLDQPPETWPTLLLLVGDQIYADDSSPKAKERIEHFRSDDVDLPPEVVICFEEYSWLYDEAWSLSLERWLLSVVPSAMIFDDHDLIDDWNISGSWVRDIREEPWWQEHATAGMMSYWIYQHLGNMSPARVRSEGLLQRLIDAEDGTEILTRWAQQSEEFTPVPGGYRFSYARHIGEVTVVVIDCRNGRVLEEDERLMVDEDEWNWIRHEALDARGHVVLATSLPVFIAGGLHDLQVWNEQVAEGAWGRRAARIGERIRRHLDLEDWSAFATSYRWFVELVDELRDQDSPPSSITVVSGDIHFSYAARLPRTGAGPNVWQVVSSPIRNALIPPERGVMRMTLTRTGSVVGAMLRRLVRCADTRPHIEMEVGPYFANNMCQLRFADEGVELTVEHSTPSDSGEPELSEVARIWLD